MEKYPRGRRGSPAKGVAGVEPGPGSNPGFSAKKDAVFHGVFLNMEGYRSGHNGAVLKTVRVKAHAGSNPAPSAMKET